MYPFNGPRRRRRRRRRVTDGKQIPPFGRKPPPRALWEVNTPLGHSDSPDSLLFWGIRNINFEGTGRIPAACLRILWGRRLPRVFLGRRSDQSCSSPDAASHRKLSGARITSDRACAVTRNIENLRCATTPDQEACHEKTGAADPARNTPRMKPSDTRRAA